jgi:YHS domain-containing protein
MCSFHPFVEKALPRIYSTSKNAALIQHKPMTRRQLLISLSTLLGSSNFAIGQARQSWPRPEKVRDPVCGISVEKDRELAAEYKGKTYYFCSKADRDKFKQNPQKYVRDK